MKLPIEVHNPLIPFKGFSWVTWLAFAFTRKPKYRHMAEETRRHEGIHCCQQIELAVLFAAILLPIAISYAFAWWGWVLVVVGILFAGWICYGISWLIEVIIPLEAAHTVLGLDFLRTESESETQKITNHEKRKSKGSA